MELAASVEPLHSAALIQHIEASDRADWEYAAALLVAPGGWMRRALSSATYGPGQEQVEWSILLRSMLANPDSFVSLVAKELVFDMVAMENGDTDETDGVVGALDLLGIPADAVREYVRTLRTELLERDEAPPQDAERQ
jgi:hypothetical protein